MSFEVNAQLFQNLLIDPKAMSLGNAVTADPPGINSIHYNPAGLRQITGRQASVSFLNASLRIENEFRAPDDFDLFGLDVEDDPVANSSGFTTRAPVLIPGFGLKRIDLPFITLPSGGFAIRPPGSKFTFANAAYAPIAVGFVRSGDDPGRYQGERLSLQRLTYLAPAFSYDISDNLTVGASFNLSHQGLAFEAPIRAPNILLGVTEILQDAFGCEEGGGGNDALAPFITICGGRIGPFRDVADFSLDLQQTLSPTYHLGLLWDATDWLTIGASYQSEANMRLEGSFNIDYTADWSGFWQSFNSSIFGAISGAILSLPQGVDREEGNVSADLTLPQHIQTGFQLRMLPNLRLNVDARWTEFSVFDEFRLEFDRPLDILGAARLLAPTQVGTQSISLDLGYEDILTIAVGLEYEPTERLQLRMGLEPRTSPIPADRASALVPLGDAILVGFGFGYQWDKDTTIDFSVSFFVSEQDIPADSSENANSTGITNVIYNPFAGLDINTTASFNVVGLTYRTKF